MNKYIFVLGTMLFLLACKYDNKVDNIRSSSIDDLYIVKLANGKYLSILFDDEGHLSHFYLDDDLDTNNLFDVNVKFNSQKLPSRIVVYDDDSELYRDMIYDTSGFLKIKSYLSGLNSKTFEKEYIEYQAVQKNAILKYSDGSEYFRSYNGQKRFAGPAFFEKIQMNENGIFSYNLVHNVFQMNRQGYHPEYFYYDLLLLDTISNTNNLFSELRYLDTLKNKDYGYKYVMRRDTLLADKGYAFVCCYLSQEESEKEMLDLSFFISDTLYVSK